ncbi:MAG: hypothetical protein IJ491_04000 [Clostridia bacterium]|nr:hypothetical protein [Clostridia bacterium]
MYKDLLGVEIRDEAILKKIRSANNIKMISIIIAVVSFICTVLGLAISVNYLGMIGLLGLMASVVVFLIFLEKYRPIIRSIKYLNKYNLHSAAKDLNSNNINLPKSKICMGNSAFYSKNFSTIVPYSMILWVYVEKIKYMAVIPVEENVNICCRDGSIFKIKANREEMQILLNQIYSCSPDLVIGYGRNQENFYHEQVYKFVKSRKSGK